MASSCLHGAMQLSCHHFPHHSRSRRTEWSRLTQLHRPHWHHSPCSAWVRHAVLLDHHGLWEQSCKSTCPIHWTCQTSGLIFLFFPLDKFLCPKVLKKHRIFMVEMWNAVSKRMAKQQKIKSRFKWSLLHLFKKENY